MRTKSQILLLVLVSIMALPSVFANPQVTNLPLSQDDYEVDNKYEPEVTARVARFSFVNGDVRIKRTGSEEWENATLNLPVVEGDEISTALGSRAELQFDSRTHLRLDGDSYLRISRLKDEGIAVSLPAGRMSVRVYEFDKDKSYFEVDAPNTTIAFQRSGMYRLDAGREGSGEIRVTALDSGEARVYSDSSGFTLKNGRSSRIFITGSNAGEWETGDASKFADEFDTWALSRDKEILEDLRTAANNNYYDDDIYGAEELNDNGEWIHTRKYGHVWRPYKNVTSRYADWSPYRYGHWRWVPPYGWTWVNDEPWGWATYHHGRWIWLDGGWSWSPYSYYRYRRNWWSPALVVFTTYGGYYAWYPLPYSYSYYNYNYYCGPPRHHGHGGGNNGGIGPVVQPTPDIYGTKSRQPPAEVVPVGGVITVKQDKFGIKNIGASVADPTTAKSVLMRTPFEKDTAPLLPGSAGTTKATAAVGNDVRVKQPQLSVATAPVKVGATVRTGDAPLDNELRTKRIFGGRNPATTVGTPSQTGGQPATGAVQRDTTVRTTTPIRQPVTPQYETQRNETSRPPVKQQPTYTPPQNTQRETTRPLVKQQPTYNPPQNTQRETPRYNPPPQNTQRETPRNNPPPVKESPKPSPPPAKSDPPADSGKRSKDGR